MKRNFLLSIIPALLILSSCAGAAPKIKENILLEDTLAHEEVFGEATIAGSLGVRKTLNPESVLKPKIGVQWKKSNDNTKIDIRYVAAISSLDVKAEWYRGVAKQDSNCPKEKYSAGEYYVKESTIGYVAINNDGNETKATDAGAGYNYFVVYTLKDIPFNEFQYSYMAAYLVLKDNESDDILKTSDVVAVNIGQQHYFSFANDQFDGYFIEGTIGGASGQFRELDDTPDNDDHAKKMGLTLNANDNFGLFKWTPTEFHYYGRYNFGGNDTFYLEDSSAVSSNYSKVRASGTYTMFVNKYNQFNLAATALTTNLYLDLSTYWQNGNEKIAIYYTDNSSFHAPDEKISNSVYRFNIDVGAHPTFIFVRSDKTLDEGEYNWWNQTQDITFRDGSSVLDNKYTLTGWDNDGGKSGYSRSSY